MRHCLLLCALLIGCTPPDDLPEGAEDLIISLPLPADSFMAGRVIGVDHDPVDHGGLGCTDYLGGFWCYDGHEGTDYSLIDSWAAMDQGVPVFAAAQGVVVGVEDGHYDRCHLGPDLNIDCDGHEQAPNYIYLDHGGWLTGYLHLREGSIDVILGDSVECGQRIGEVGSSGMSLFPHLHFEVWLNDQVIDPRQVGYKECE